MPHFMLRNLFWCLDLQFCYSTCFASRACPRAGVAAIRPIFAGCTRVACLANGVPWSFVNLELACECDVGWKLGKHNAESFAFKISCVLARLMHMEIAFTYHSLIVLSSPFVQAVHVPTLESPQPDRYLPAAHVSHAWHVLFHDPVSILNLPA